MAPRPQRISSACLPPCADVNTKSGCAITEVGSQNMPSGKSARIVFLRIWCSRHLIPDAVAGVRVRVPVAGIPISSLILPAQLRPALDLKS